MKYQIKIVIEVCKIFKLVLLQGYILMMLSSSFFIAITPSINGLCAKRLYNMF